MFNSIMWKYIDEEKEALTNVLKQKETQEVAKQLKEKGYTSIYFVAHGSSYNASVSLTDFFTRMTGLRAFAYPPENFIMNCTNIYKEDNPLLIGISQTGTSRGVLEAIAKSKEASVSSLGLTSVKNSKITTYANHHLYFDCGEEDSNAKTKGYSSTLLILILLAIYLGLENGTIDLQVVEDVKQEIKESINQLDDLKKHVIKCLDQFEYGKEVKDFYVIGTGMNFGTAQEGQLKMMETLCIPTMFNNLGEFPHGMHRSINRNSSVVLLQIGDCFEDDMKNTWNFLKEATNKPILITTKEKETENELIINIPYYRYTESILLTVLLIQIISCYVPEVNGLEPNRPSNELYVKQVDTRI